MRILVVEDEYSLADAMGEALKRENYMVDISYEGNSIDELKDDFQNGIDDYLENCRINGEEPEKENDN